MRAVVQRVSQASVSIEGQLTAAIDKGLLVLVAIEDIDSQEDVTWLAGKIARLRIFNDENNLMNQSLCEAGGDILAVSQFTLFASTRKGNRPSFTRASRPERAIPLYESFLRELKSQSQRPVLAGQFGADMKVSLINDGPVTVIIDTKLRE